MQTSDRQRFLMSLGLLLAMVVLEALLLGIAGAPSGHIRVLAGLTNPLAEPLDGVLAALALSAQVLSAYLAMALTLRMLTQLPGLVGRVADGAERALTLPAVRRVLDALLGGALIAQLALAPTSIGTMQASRPAAVTTVATVGQASRRTPAGPTTAQQVTSAPATSAPAASVPLPIWLGGRRPTSGPPPVDRPDATAGPGAVGAARVAPVPPSSAGDASTTRAAERGREEAGSAGARHSIEPGETLWTISAAHLPAAARSAADIARYWRLIFGANRGWLGADPNLIHPGVTLAIPPWDAVSSSPPPGAVETAAALPARPRPGGVTDSLSDRLP